MSAMGYRQILRGPGSHWKMPSCGEWCPPKTGDQGLNFSIVGSADSGSVYSQNFSSKQTWGRSNGRNTRLHNVEVCPPASLRGWVQ